MFSTIITTDFTLQNTGQTDLWWAREYSVTLLCEYFVFILWLVCDYFVIVLWLIMFDYSLILFCDFFVIILFVIIV